MYSANTLSGFSTTCLHRKPYRRSSDEMFMQSLLTKSIIVAISSIHLLQVFLNSSSYTTEQLMWLTIIHLAFVASAFMLAYIDRLMGLAKGKKTEAVSP